MKVEIVKLDPMDGWSTKPTFIGWALLNGEPLCFKYAVGSRMHGCQGVIGITNAYIVPTNEKANNRLLDKLSYARKDFKNKMYLINKYEKELTRFGYKIE